MSLRGKTVRWAFAASALACAVTALLMIPDASVSAQTPPPSATPATNLGGPPTVPTRFNGSVRNASGAGILNGTVVVASAGGAACGTGTVVDGTYQLDAQLIGGCAKPGTAVTFTVGGQPATATGDATMSDLGASKHVDLTVSAATPTPAPATPPPTVRPATASPAPAAASKPQSPTPAPALTQAQQRQAATLTASGEYISGPTQLTVGATTRVQVTLTLTNNYTEPVHYGKTVAADIGGGVSVVSADASVGSAITTNPGVLVYSVDTLNPGESSSLTATLDVTPPSTAVGAAMPLYTNVNVDAITERGLKINYSMGPVTASIIRGLVANGQVAGATPPSAGGAVTVAPRPVVVSGGLPSTGTGGLADADRSSEASRFPLALLFSGIAAGVSLLGLLCLYTKRPAD